MSCERCDRQAARRVCAADLVEDGFREGALRLVVTDEPAVAAALVCAAHEQDLMDQLCDEYGCAASRPLRMTWRYWFLRRCWLGRPFSRFWTWRHNRRMKRILREP